MSREGYYPSLFLSLSLNTDAVATRTMKLFLDCSDVDLISDAYGTGLIDGITTNPTLIKQSGRDPKEVLQEISDIFSWEASVSAEVMGETSEEMLDMAEEYIALGPNITIKVPCTYHGLLACRELSIQGVSTNVTLIFSTAQAILASKAGATYVSPFVGRLNDQYWDGISLVEEISDVYATHNADTKVLAASIREPSQVAKCFKVGADICTIPHNVFMKMYMHCLTDSGLDIFRRDWNSVQNSIK